MLVTAIHNDFINETFKLSLWKILRSPIKFNTLKIHLRYNTLRQVKWFAYEIAQKQHGIGLSDVAWIKIN